MHASIDSLPSDALVRILCKLNHDELEPLLRVSKSLRDAALVARQLHFDYSTPAPTKRMAFPGREMAGTPGGPSLKLECRKPPRKYKLSEEETRRIAVVLFPNGDNKGLIDPKPRWTSESIMPRGRSSVARVSNANV